MGFGNRRIIRRQADNAVIFIVDQFSPALFVPIMAILFFSVFDAAHSSQLIRPLTVAEMHSLITTTPKTAVRMTATACHMN